MATKTYTVNGQAFAWGVMAGMRSLSAPAFSSHLFAHMPDAGLSGSFLSFLQSSRVATTLKILAASEVVGDKLPGAPNRIAAPVLVVRLLSGALVGTAWSEHNGQSKEVGALLGGVGALAASYGFYYLRTRLSQKTPVPDLVWALLEDGLVATLGISLAKASLNTEVMANVKNLTAS
ncbi:DUF4126 domain-containing protein [Adhaeribacter arboris]|uniref:DUF4126 domain-containing protein n=1 Tax=Adhaeribacter arboris TaxID=2072846 RepID=A0A2T2YAG7_9BACT|nr:DUF4126 family protein [Adhaeribacter arboris]PSR52520.1 DUF4126 domain-containing protein [Adhaeribacter arboris]